MFVANWHLKNHDTQIQITAVDLKVMHLPLAKSCNCDTELDYSEMLGSKEVATSSQATGHTEGTVKDIGEWPGNNLDNGHLQGMYVRVDLNTRCLLPYTASVLSPLALFSTLQRDASSQVLHKRSCATVLSCYCACV